uniref:Uncharacterized protein n=1 Tax=Trichogramma kaykai TaxID=54128 RepID=A0ABD2X9U8_9HYME
MNRVNAIKKKKGWQFCEANYFSSQSFTSFNSTECHLPFPIFSENHATRYNVPYAVRNVSLVTFTALSLKTVWDILAPVFNHHKQQLILNKTI